MDFGLLLGMMTQCEDKQTEPFIVKARVGDGYYSYRVLVTVQITLYLTLWNIELRFGRGIWTGVCRNSKLIKLSG